jgi:hypothetical protein
MIGFLSFITAVYLRQHFYLGDVLPSEIYNFTIQYLT